jgi:hypothetical protein
MDDFDAILSPEISATAVRSGNEWLIPLPQTKVAIGLATKHQIAVLGVEVLRVLPDGLGVEGYSGYEFRVEDDWVKFVSRNNEAAFQYVVEHEFGNGYGYVLTTTSAKEFEALRES